MTPKSKAIEIFDRMFSSSRNIEEFEAKQCALVAVNEILQIQWYHSEPTCFDDLANEYKEKSVFWNEVKSEIEKL